MKRRRLWIALGLGILSGAGLLGYWISRSIEADGLVADARARLSAPLTEAPELDRIQASTAESLLARAIDLGRDDRETDGLHRYATALVHLQRGDLVFATTTYDSARQSLGETSDVQVLGAEILRRKTDHEAARALVEEVLARDPSHRRALLLRADLDLDEGRAARDDLEKLVALEPDAACVHNRLALAYELDGDLDRAETHLARATELGPDIIDGWINLGRIRARQERFEEAERAFERALGLSRGDPDAYLGRGLARSSLGEVTGAERDFRRAAELAPNDAEPLLALGDLLRDAGRVEDAIESYREALARESADAASWLKLGNALVLDGDSELAARAFEEALERAPDLAPAHNGLGAALMHLGELDAASRALERAAALDASDPNPLLNLALVRRRSGDERGARAAFDEAVHRDPTARDRASRALGFAGG